MASYALFFVLYNLRWSWRRVFQGTVSGTYSLVQRSLRKLDIWSLSARALFFLWTANINSLPLALLKTALQGSGKLVTQIDTNRLFPVMQLWLILIGYLKNDNLMSCYFFTWTCQFLRMLIIDSRGKFAFRNNNLSNFDLNKEFWHIRSIWNSEQRKLIFLTGDRKTL